MVSELFVLAFTVVGLLMPYAFPQMSGAGLAIYLAVVLLIAGGFSVARIIERQADATAKRKSEGDIERLSRDMAETLRVLRAVEQRLPPGSPERKTTEMAIGEILLHWPGLSISGTGTVTAPPFTPGA
jgi:hypothetical protein